MEQFVTVPEAAIELGVTETTVRRYCYDGRLGQKIGRQWLITRAELDQFKATPRPPGRPPKDESQ